MANLIVNVADTIRVLMAGLFQLFCAPNSSEVYCSLPVSSWEAVVTRGDLYRCDTINFDSATMKPISGLNRVEISNELGNWEMGDGQGKEGIAFLLKNNEMPTETIGLNNGLKIDAQTIDSPDDNDSFSVANGTVGEEPVLYVTRTIALNGAPAGTSIAEVYTIDAATGNLLAMGSPSGNGIVQHFELNPTIDEADFSILDSQVVVPVSSVSAAQV
jgi:hypothetical protein